MCIICECRQQDNLSAIETAEELHVDKCENIIWFPYLPKLKKLSCNNCLNLQTIRTFPNLETLSCNWCINLTVIEDQPNLRKLSCHSCFALKNIAPSLLYLFDYRRYDKLTDMPMYPFLYDLQTIM